MKSRITDIEILLMHQEDTLQQLNEVVVHQQQMIDRLTAEVEMLKQQVRAVAASAADVPPEETPPHY